VLFNRLQQPVMRRLPGSRYNLVCVFMRKDSDLVLIQFALVRGRFGHPVFPIPQLGHNRPVPLAFDLSFSSPISWHVRQNARDVLAEDFDSVAHFESQRCLLRCIPLRCRSGLSLREALLHDPTAGAAGVERTLCEKKPLKTGVRRGQTRYGQQLSGYTALRSSSSAAISVERLALCVERLALLLQLLLRVFALRSETARSASRPAAC